MASGDMEQEGRERPVYLCDRGTSTANPRPVLRSRDPPQPITGQVRLGSQCRSKLRAEVGQLQAGIVIGSLNYRNYQIQLILPYGSSCSRVSSEIPSLSLAPGLHRGNILVSGNKTFLY